MSGPLLDRIDALIEVPPLTPAALEDRSAGEPSAAVRRRVEAAREFRRAREGRSAQQVHEGKGGRPEVRDQFSGSARSLLHEALLRDALSGRGYVRVVRLARTIADLDKAETINADHVAEALSLRLDYRRLAFV